MSPLCAMNATIRRRSCQSIFGSWSAPMLSSTSGGVFARATVYYSSAKRCDLSNLTEKFGILDPSTDEGMLITRSELASKCRCSQVWVRRVAVPKNEQHARITCSWTTTPTGKLSNFGLKPRRSSNFSFCFSQHPDSGCLRVPKPGTPPSANFVWRTVVESDQPYLKVETKTGIDCMNRLFQL